MLFNSLQFLGFFPGICLFYWFLNSILPQKHRLIVCNMLLLVGSYYFYMCWQPKYALLLLLSTSVTYCSAILIENSVSNRAKKIWLTSAIILNLAILFFYKYYAFAADSITALLSSMGIAINIPGFDILLPVGISFYIFQALGYSIDVYRGNVRAERNFFTYALFVSFFPQLVAGPIERSTNLLPQFKEYHKFDYDFAMSGFKLMLWGYFIKLCIADRAALYVDPVFNNINSHDGCSTLVASILFTIQIYGDFAGYTFIAIGCGRILGFRLNDNFRSPYFAVSITDFWRRWHISLSTWLRDYVYFPLGGSRTTKAKTYRNLLITFGISGLWHGANWTFVLWGMLHGVAMCVERALGWNKKTFHSWNKLLHVFVTLFLVNLAWVLFRANTVSDAIVICGRMFSSATLHMGMSIKMFVMLTCCISILVAKEVNEEYGLVKLRAGTFVGNYLLPMAMLLLIGIFGVFDGGQFIYFQF